MCTRFSNNEESPRETWQLHPRIRTYRYDQPSQDREYDDERTRTNKRAWHNDEIIRETYNAQRGNYFRRRRYIYDQPSQDGEYGDERTRTNKRACHDDEIPTTTIHGTNTPDNTHITMTHVGYNAKGFKQSCMYVSELLSHADTVGITETWLRPGELSVIKPTLLGSPALNNVNADDLVIFAKSGMCNIDPSYTGRPYGGVAVACRTKVNIVYAEIPIANDRVIGVKVLNNSDIVETRRVPVQRAVDWDEIPYPYKVHDTTLRPLSIIKLEGQLFRTGRRISPKFCTHVRI